MFNKSNFLGALHNGGNEGGEQRRSGGGKVLGSTAILLSVFLRRNRMREIFYRSHCFMANKMQYNKWMTVLLYWRCNSMQQSLTAIRINLHPVFCSLFRTWRMLAIILCASYSINCLLRTIGRRFTLSCDLMMYVSRYSRESVVNNKGIPIFIISEKLGHDSEKTTLDLPRYLGLFKKMIMHLVLLSICCK